MATEAEAPPSLVRYDPALRVDAKQDADALSTRVSKAKAMGAASDAQIDEIINSILPPRFVHPLLTPESCSLATSSVSHPAFTPA